MSYNEIYKLKYTTVDIEDEYHKRFNSYSAMKTKFINKNTNSSYLNKNLAINFDALLQKLMQEDSNAF